MASISSVPGAARPGPAAGAARVASRAWRWAKDHYLAVGISALLLWIVGVPLLSAITFSFRSGTPVNPGGFTLQNYRDAYLNPQTGPALANTIVYAVVVSIVGLALATLFAWLVERTDMPGRMASMAWILLLSDKIGLLNMFMRGGLSAVGVHMQTGPFNIYSLKGMIFVEGIRGSTTLFLIMVAAFRLMETPLLIGVPAGVFLLPTLIYFTASERAQWGLSSAYTTIFLLITVAMVLIYHRVVLRRAGQFATITGKAYRPRRTPLGRWRYPALGVFIGYFAVTIALPAIVLIWASLLPAYEVPSLAALRRVSLDNYLTLFHQTRIVNAVWNTSVLAVVTATATMALAFLLAWLIVRQQVKGGVGLDALGFIPHAIPSVAVGVALVSFYLNPWLRWTGIDGTTTILVLALMTRYMAFATRTSNSAMTQLGKDLEEAAYVSGVGRLRALGRVTLRLLSPAFIAGWIWVGAHALKNLSIPLMLATPKTDTIATTLYFYWQRKADFSLSAALGVMFLLVLSVVAVIGRKFLASGFSGDR